MELLVEIRTVIRCKYRPIAVPHPNGHTHEFYQLVCIAAGQGWIAVGDERYVAKEGDVFLLLPEVAHNIYVLPGEAMTTYELKFDAAPPLAGRLVGVPPRILGGIERVRALLSFAAEEGQGRRPYDRELIALAVEGALYFLLRGNPPASPETVVTELESEAPTLFRVRAFLDSHLDANVTLDSLAEQFSLSREHLCRRFSVAFGLSPIRYLNARRHERACALLSGTDMTVTEIAAATGYSNVHYFSRAFRTAEGVTPLAYRARRRDNVRVDF